MSLFQNLYLFIFGTYTLWQGLSIIFQGSVYDGILSVDNAAYIGKIVAGVPKPYQGLVRNVGMGLALVFRILMLIAAEWLLGLTIGSIPGVGGLHFLAPVAHLKLFVLIGAIYLFYLPAKHFYDTFTGKPEKDPRLNVQSMILWAIINVAIADALFSVDNVVAVLALTSHVPLISLAVAISIIILMFASFVFTKLIDWEPFLIHGIFAILFTLSISLFLKLVGIEEESLIQFGISISLIVGTIVLGRMMRHGKFPKLAAFFRLELAEEAAEVALATEVSTPEIEGVITSQLRNDSSEAPIDAGTPALQRRKTGDL